MLHKPYKLKSAIFISIWIWLISSPVHASQVDWQPYNHQSFEKARTQNKLILLDIKAVWCHWCHVMDKETYDNAQVSRYLSQHYISIQVDHDARPDLAERYRNWGWPATIIMTAEGQELLKHAGYIPPEKMLGYLREALESPANHATLSYPKTVNKEPELSLAVRDKLIARHFSSFDSELGGLKMGQKYIDSDAIAWNLFIYQNGYASQKPIAKNQVILTLNHAEKLIDPAFGGIYQYSTYGDWQHPHYEKIMSRQWHSIRAYASAYQIFKKPKYRESAKKIAAFLTDYLSADNGGFYCSQDADLIQGIKADAYFSLNASERLAKGLPRIDKNEYAAETGMAADALLSLYDITQQSEYLHRAEKALVWAYQNRRLGRGGYRHNNDDVNFAYLSDTLFMGIAWLHDYKITRNLLALQQAELARDFIAKHFQHPKAGLLSAENNQSPLTPLPQMDQNIEAANFLISLYESSGDIKTMALLTHVLRYLNTPSIALSRITDAGILLVNARYQSITQK